LWLGVGVGAFLRLRLGFFLLRLRFLLSQLKGFIQSLVEPFIICVLESSNGNVLLDAKVHNLV